MHTLQNTKRWTDTMSEATDIVAELDAWRENVPLNTAFPIDTASIAMTLVQRARDEIVALRVRYEASQDALRECMEDATTLHEKCQKDSEVVAAIGNMARRDA